MPPKIATCVHCRQMKVKCNARDAAPGSCSRCVKQRLACYIDPAFHRTAKRKKMRDLEEELKQIKDSMDAPSKKVLRRTEQSHSDAGTCEVVEIQPSKSTHEPITPTSMALNALQIGDVTLTAEAVAKIVSCYFETCHPNFPILSDHAVFMETCDQSEFLLWTVIAVGSAELSDYSTIRALLEPHIRDMATQVYGVLDYPLQTVQALILLCWWPYSFCSHREDPSWLYCGQAVHLALLYGLHRPHKHSNFVYNTTLDEEGILTYQRAWVACFIVNQMLSSQLGIPATVVPPTFPQSSSTKLQLPLVLRQHLEIATHGYHICHVLGDHETTVSGLLPSPESTIRAFDQQLNDLRTTISGDGEQNILVEMALLRVQLQLLSFNFIQEASPSHRTGSLPSTADPAAVSYMSRAVKTAVSIIDVVVDRLAEKGKTAMVSFGAMGAVHLLIMIVGIYGHEDQGVIRSAIGRGWRFLNDRSEFESDSFSRACKIVSFLSRSRDGESGNPALHTPVQARMAANFAFENAWKAKHRFSKSVRDSRPRDYTTAAALEEISLRGVPDEIFDDDFFENYNMDGMFDWFSGL
ncbi:hypothetical protein JDV02_010377 [Purpureocillium takamizusanense]|uniref:Zn(2)-C6 fungal-type domain-containing protein n=1 Tax=Purpureocillium takamizusanense TaxID=2060973 RepID=A0A9Q8QTX5_9HYPO|nr:uncharacterized protein JDV02_010377 [Purpureocillium takamizusanense]UNI24644.1 hypothetical protein JDV02_010377 [Purpureocillium takamizusanense]